MKEEQVMMGNSKNNASEGWLPSGNLLNKVWVEAVVPCSFWERLSVKTALADA